MILSDAVSLISYFYTKYNIIHFFKENCKAF